MTYQTLNLTFAADVMKTSLFPKPLKRCGLLYPRSRVIEHTLVSFRFMHAIEISLPSSAKN